MKTHFFNVKTYFSPQVIFSSSARFMNTIDLVLEESFSLDIVVLEA
jgi:hypothetical protein